MRLVFFILLLSQSCIAQTVAKVLVVPLKGSHIYFEHKSEKVLQRNRVSEDSARKIITNHALSRLNSNLTGCEILWSNQFPELNFLLDSVAVMETFVSFYYTGETSSDGFQKLITAVDKDIRKLYYGRVLTNKEVNAIKKVIVAEKLDYVILINRFDINSPGFYPHQICYHVEVYDKEMRLIFGGKSGTAYDFSKKIYFGVLNYYYKNAADDVFEQVKNLLKQ
jgi:hypothetical protein